jgi:hypothetical protein
LDLLIIALQETTEKKNSAIYLLGETFSVSADSHHPLGEIN